MELVERRPVEGCLQCLVGHGVAALELAAWLFGVRELTQERAGERDVARLFLASGAGDGTRTHDILLGKQTLYQLSYTRIIFRRGL